MTFLRPDSNIVQTSYTGGFAEIDEVTASDTDLAFGAINSATPTLQVGLSNPANSPGGVVGVVRWRSAIRNGNAVIGSGNSLTATCSLLDGTIQIASDSYTASGGYTTRSFEFLLADVGNFNDLRLVFEQTASGGTNNNTRTGLAVSWAEVDIPDPRRVFVIT